MRSAGLLSQSASMDIHTLAQDCLKRFHEVNAKNSSRSLEDEMGRFRVWTGNLSAHRPASSRRSLEYRLRDSLVLRHTVNSLLRDLQVALTAAEALDGLHSESGVSETRDRATVAAVAPQGLDDELADDDMFELSDEDIFEDTSTGVQLMQLERLCNEIEEINTCLFRFASTLRNPARLDRIRFGSSVIAKYYELWAYEHVKEKFPRASSFLHQRVARNMSANKQYVSYRQQTHHEKLQEGLDEAMSAAGRPSTLATSRPETHAFDRVSLSGDQYDAESIGTATSYAATLNEATTLRPPAWPEDGQGGRPFECPLCYCIIIADSERSWRQHVFEDINPYCCTHESCLDSNRSFARRREWARHERRLHHSQWGCPYGCGTPPMTEASTFEAHIRDTHDSGIAQTTLLSIIESERRPRTRDATLKCLFCSRLFQFERSYVSHVCRHYEQLALFTLPQHLLSTEDDSDEITQAHEYVSGKASQGTGSEADDLSRDNGASDDTLSLNADAVHWRRIQRQDEGGEASLENFWLSHNADNGMQEEGRKTHLRRVLEARAEQLTEEARGKNEDDEQDRDRKRITNQDEQMQHVMADTAEVEGDQGDATMKLLREKLKQLREEAKRSRELDKRKAEELARAENQKSAKATRRS